MFSTNNHMMNCSIKLWKFASFVNLLVFSSLIYQICNKNSFLIHFPHLHVIFYPQCNMSVWRPAMYYTEPSPPLETLRSVVFHQKQTSLWLIYIGWYRNATILPSNTVTVSPKHFEFYNIFTSFSLLLWTLTSLSHISQADSSDIYFHFCPYIYIYMYILSGS